MPKKFTMEDVNKQIDDILNPPKSRLKPLGKLPTLKDRLDKSALQRLTNKREL